MALRKQKSRKQQVAELAVDYLKIKTATKAAKGAKKAAKGTAAYQVAKRTPLKKVGLIQSPSFIGAIASRTASNRASGNRGRNFES